MTSASNRPIHTGLPRFAAGWRRCAPPTGGEACCAPAAPGRGHGICVDHHAQPARQIRQRLRPLGRLHGQALVDDAQELLAVLGQAQLGQGFVGVVDAPFRRGRRTQAGDQRVHHRAQPIHVGPGPARPLSRVGIQFDRRESGRGRQGVAARAGHHQLRQEVGAGTLVHADGVQRDVATDLALRMQGHQRRQQIGQQALDARLRHASRRGRGDGAQGRNANGAAPENGPRGVNRPADDDMFKAVLGTCVPGNDGY